MHLSSTHYERVFRFLAAHSASCSAIAVRSQIEFLAFHCRTIAFKARNVAFKSRIKFRLKFVQDLTAKVTLSLFFATDLGRFWIQTSRQIPGFKCSKTTNPGTFRDLSTAGHQDCWLLGGRAGLVAQLWKAALFHLWLRDTVSA